MFFPVHNLKIDGKLSVDRLDKFNIIAKFGHHTILNYEGMISSQRIEEIKKELNTKEQMTIEDKDGKRIFVGYPLTAELLVNGQICRLRVSCISYSYLSDIKTYNQSFQDINATYNDVLSEAYLKHNDAGVLFRKKSEVKIGKPFFQYLETEWQLAKRVAAILKTVCYQNDLSNSSEIYIGESKNINKLTEHRVVDEGYMTEQYLMDSLKDTKINMSDYYFCKIESNAYYQIGDSVSINNRTLVVSEKELILVNAEIRATYILSEVVPYVEKEDRNIYLSGLSLKGTTLDTHGSKIKVHLDIDNKQSLNKAYWFDYKTISGNVMHSMPEIGMSVFLQFNDAYGNAQVIHAVQINSPKVPDRSDYNNRYLTTSYNKRMAMLPKILYFSSDSNLLQLDDTKGIIVNTGGHIKISAAHNLLLQASGKVSLFTPEHIYMTKPGSKSVIDLAGNEINIESPNTVVASNPDARQRPYPPTTDGPPMQIGKGLAAIVLGAAPIVASTKRNQ